MSGQHKRVTLGRVSGVFGVKGWIKVHSYTEPRENILGFDRWTLEQNGRVSEVEVEDGRAHGKGLVAKLAGCDDRDRALELIGAEISVERAALPRLGPDEYYWTDLEGLEVRTPSGESLGRVDHLLATGANDVLVVRGERELLIPFVLERVIRDVDLASGVIVADWDPEPGGE